MSGLKAISTLLPPVIRSPLRKLWRAAKGAPDLNLLRLMSDPGKIALDIGANAGDYACDMVKHSRIVEAFEPVPGLIPIIQSKCPERVRIHNCALSDKTGSVTLRIPITGVGQNPANATLESDDRSVGASHDIEVPCYRLDDMTLDEVGVIKMDAEGHERAILDGAVKLIERDSPNVLMEADDSRHRPGCVDAARKFFGERNYTGFFLLGRRLRPIADFSFDLHQNPKNLNEHNLVIEGRDYVDTLVFARRPEVVKKLRKIAEEGTSL